MIRARGLAFSYERGRDVVADVDLDLARGEILAILGPNGAGKSTLVRMLAGELRPSRGTIELEGMCLRAIPRRELARRVAVVPQETSISFPFTVGELVLMGRAPYTGPLAFEREEDIDAAARAIAALDLTEHRDRPATTLSGGERRRVAIARALAQEPRLLVLDEPAAYLDLKHQVSLFRLLRVLARERGTSSIIVSHDVAIAARHADRVLLLERGRVRASGAPADALRPDLLREVFEVEVELVSSERTGRRHFIFGAEA